MPHNVALITTIAASLGLALVMGLLANRVKLPPIVGYLIAGVITGRLRRVSWRMRGSPASWPKSASSC